MCECWCYRAKNATNKCINSAHVGAYPRPKTSLFVFIINARARSTSFSSFRPHPESRSRWIFNWTHWFIGNSAHVIGGEHKNLHVLPIPHWLSNHPYQQQLHFPCLLNHYLQQLWQCSLPSSWKRPRWRKWSLGFWLPMSSFMSSLTLYWGEHCLWLTLLWVSCTENMLWTCGTLDYAHLREVK